MKGTPMQRKAVRLVLLGVFMAAGGCVQVSAPEKPIEINLNINIRQEVLVRLEQDVENLINENPDVFGTPTETNDDPSQ